MTQSQNYREAKRLAEQAHHFTYGDGADPVAGAALAAEAQVYATLELADAQRAAATPTSPRTVYRASHESIVMGLYDTREAARAHCEAEERLTGATGTALSYTWIPDDSDPMSAEELTIFDHTDIGDDGAPAETTTGYVVTPLTVAATYDPEAES